VPRVAGIEDPTTYLLTENEESQKKANSTPTKTHGSRRNQGFGSGACITSYTRAPHQLVLKTCDAARSRAPPYRAGNEKTVGRGMYASKHAWT
jgi:hypothetical protein